jgi:opacity protein-like surface antigen
VRKEISARRWPLSLYGFGGLAIGDVNISASPFSAALTMGGWSIGVGADLQLSPNWSVGLKNRHFDLGNATFTVFPGRHQPCHRARRHGHRHAELSISDRGTRTRPANSHEIATLRLLAAFAYRRSWHKADINAALPLCRHVGL